jgi:glycosyltransferase involved in cell wall biosynthesis
MKIIILNHNRKEIGTYHRCNGFARQLANKDHFVHFFCLRRERKKWLSKRIENNIIFIELPWYSNNGLLATFEHFFRGVYIVLYGLQIKDLNVVHAFNVASPMIAFSTMMLYVIKKFKKFKIVVDWDDVWGRGGLVSYDNKGKIQEEVAHFFETKIPLLADVVTTTNNYLFQTAILCGVKKEKIVIIYNGSDHEDFDSYIDKDLTKGVIRQKLSLSDDQIVLFYGGAIVTSVPFLLKAISEIKTGKIAFIAIGRFSDNQRSEIYHIAQKLGLKDKIIIKGVVSYRVYIECLMAADILLLPRSSDSVSDLSTFPGRLADYMLSNRPIVASDVGELSIIFRNDRIGYLSKSDDVSDFSSNISDIIENEEFAMEMAANARKVSVEKYSWKKLTDKLINRVYNADF